MTPAQSEKLLELAAKCEVASQDDRDIDAEIACIIGKPLGNIDHWLHGSDIRYEPTAYGFYVAVIPDVMAPDGIRKSEAFKAKEFTASIDVALTLIPTDLFPTIDFVTKRVWIRDAKGFDVGFEPAHGFAATVPLSICAAALRARATQTNGA